MEKKEKIFLRIKDFRSFEDITFEFRPLNFIFGPNGAGKSSFIKATKFLSHNLFNLDDTLFFEGLKPLTNRYKVDKDTDLISFIETVRNNDINKKIVFEIIIKNIEISYDNYEKFLVKKNYIEKTSRLFNKSRNIENEITDISVKVEISNNLDLTKRERIQITITDILNAISFEFTPDSASDKNQNTYDRKVSISGNNNNYNTIETYLKSTGVMPFIQTNSNYEKYSLENEFNRFERVLILEKVPEIEKKDICIETFKVFYKLFFAIPYKIKDIFYNVEHLPAIREVPKYAYLLNEGRFPENEYYGILTAFAEDMGIQYRVDEDNLFHNIDTTSNTISIGPFISFTDFVNKTLLQLGLAKEIIVKKEERSGWINYITMENGVETNLAGASSGLLQLLPIIFKAINFKKYINDPSNGLKFIEQPELHLHPKLQAELANFFCSKNIINNNLIIETHSEHMVRKLQVLIAQGKLKNEQVAIYYFNKDQKTGVTSIKEMKLEDNGFFKEPWPGGFFDDSYNLARELIYARKN